MGMGVVRWERWVVRWEWGRLDGNGGVVRWERWGGVMVMVGGQMGMVGW